MGVENRIKFGAYAMALSKACITAHNENLRDLQKKMCDKFHREIPEDVQDWFFEGHSTILPLGNAVYPEYDPEEFSDGIDYNYPACSGLYFVGQTHFNPITKEEFYWVKIGKASNIANRMAGYRTSCPMLYHIDYRKGSQKAEKVYHILLKSKSIAKCNHNKEWFMVDRETYLEMCEKGFSYFD